MTAEQTIRSYLPLVDFISEVSGPNTEVVLHDVRDRQHSLVAIRNGHLSGREAGASMTDFASHILRYGTEEGKDHITNYLGKAGGNGKFLKSSTFFIRDEGGSVVGMLGINSDLSALSEVHKILGRILAVDETEDRLENEDEKRESEPSVKAMVFSVMDQVLNARAIDPARMTTEEKKDVVDALNEKGVFLLKGTVAEVASRLDVSEQTVYRYLK